MSRQIECVKLFLDHPNCNNDIVRIKNNSGETADMIADSACAKLIRKYLKDNDDREVTDLVEFITGGETQKKKKRQKRKNPALSTTRLDITGHSGVNGSKMADVGGKEKENGIVTKTKHDLSTGDIDDTIIEVDFEKQPETCIHKEAHESNTLRANLKMIEADLEEKIAEKCVHFDEHKENVKDLIHSNSIKIKNLDSMIEKSQYEKGMKLNVVDKLEKELSDLETKMAKLKLKKTELLEESKIDGKRIKKYEEKKHKLEDDIERELKISKQKGDALTEEIQDLETRLQETKSSIQNIPDDDKLSYEPNSELLEFIDNKIIEKEKELECPVCLDVACSPIFMCSEQHLICSTCRPKLSNCPECRVLYTGKNRRHRYAEKTAEELNSLKNKKDQVRKRRVSTDFIKDRLVLF